MNEEQTTSATNQEENQEGFYNENPETSNEQSGNTPNPEDNVSAPVESEPLSSDSPQEEVISSLDDNQENLEIITSLQQENANLKNLLDERIKQSNGIKGQYARLAADFDNFRKRNAKEKENLEKQAKKNVIVGLLAVVDNFERARMQIKPETDGEKTIHNSYQGVYKTLVDSLKKMGVAAMRPEGQEFDPNFHEAMMREATDQHPEGTVIEQLMRGYTLGEEVLRHAMVKVAVPQEPVITSEEEQAIEENPSENLDSGD